MTALAALRRPSAWSVRHKVLAVSALLLTALLGVAQFVLLGIVGPGFAALDEAAARAHGNRVANTVWAEVDTLSRLAMDYSYWDDAYAFVRTRDPAFVESNLTEGTLRSLRIDLAQYQDTGGRVVWRGTEVPPRDEEAARRVLQEGGADLRGLTALTQEGTLGVTGLIDTALGPMMVSAQPILTSLGEGPSRGLLLMGRLVSAEVLASYSDLLGVDIATWAASDPALPSGAAAAIESRPRPALAPMPADPEALGVYVALEDMAGDPLVVLGARIDRAAHAVGRTTLHTAVLLTGLVGAALIAVTLWSLERLVLRPLAHLSRHVADIADTGNLTTALDLAREDELGALATGFRRMQERVAQLAYFDTVTGLPNRRLFEDRAEQVLRFARRTGQQVAILFLDLDGFKLINDTRGHAEGDAVLRSVARELHTLVRDSDTVARFGGDEFAIVLQDLEGIGQARELAQRLHARFAHPFRHSSGAAFVGASVGVAVFPDDGEHIEDLLQAADAAMYQAKSAGGHRVCVLDRARHREAETWMDLTLALREALLEGQLFLAFQPQVDLITGAVVGHEALVRWRHPVRGVLKADEFLHQAYRGRLYVDLDTWVLRAACDALAGRGRADGPAPRRVAVNLCAHHVDHASLPDLVEKILRNAGVAPNRLMLEITEAAIVSHPEEAHTVLTALRALGVHVAVDDFGIGPASLAALQRCPADILKIDASLVAALPDDPAASTVVRAILSLAETFGLDVVAKGIETEPQRAFLVAAGCRIGQGHLLDR